MDAIWFGLTRFLRQRSHRGRFALSILSIAAGLVILLVTIGIMDGYRRQLWQVLYRFFSPAEVVFPEGKRVPSESTSFLEPQITSSGMLIPCDERQGSFVKIKGKRDISGLRVGKGLAETLGLKPGACVQLLLPQLESSPKIKVAKVKEVFSSGLWTVDGEWIEMPIGWLDGVVGTHYYALKEGAQLSKLRPLFPPGTQVFTLQDTQGDLFSMLSFQEKVMAFILSLITLVAGVFLLSRLMLDLHERGRTFGVMQALGMTKLELFILITSYGVIVGALGVFSGIGIAMSGMTLVNHTHLLAFPEGFRQVYGISHLSLYVEPQNLLGVTLFGLFVVLGAAISCAFWILRRPSLEALHFS